MTSREQFEAECRNGLINGGLAKHENGKYASELTDAVWRGWQASREALEIKLPPAINTEEIGVAISKERTMARLAFAGIKVKGE